MSKMTLRYLGKSLDLSSGVFGDAVQVMIMQQHCGGNTVCVFQGLVSPNECFTFTSRRHRDAPFGITIYLGSMMVRWNLEMGYWVLRIAYVARIISAFFILILSSNLRCDHHG